MKHTLFNMHVLDALKRIPDGSVDCVFTSPPYYGLRLYSGAGVVWDGDAGCQHEWLTKNVGLLHENRNNVSGTQEEAHEATPTTFIRKFDSIEAGTCTRCGAWKGQLGLEPAYKLFVSHLLQITAELKRVLKPTGTLFWNMGDSYAGDMGKRSGWNDNKMTKSKEEALVDGTAFFLKADYGGIQRKSLMMIPERFAMRMVDEQQWTLRNKIIWRKPNGIPSSVKDRFSNKWEYVFFFSRNAKYYFNLDGVRVPLAASTLKEIAEGYRGRSVKDYGSAKAQDASETKKRIIASYRSGNKERKIEQFRLTHLGSSVPWSAEDSPMGANPGDILEITLQPGARTSREGYNSKYEPSLTGQTLQGFERNNTIFNDRQQSYTDAKKLFPNDIKKQKEYIKNIHDHNTPNPLGANPGDIVSDYADWYFGEREKKAWVDHENDAEQGFKQIRERGIEKTPYPYGANPGDLFSIPTHSHPFAHFAVFPEQLVEPFLKAGCPKGGVVLDPFAGSGTVAVVARRMGLSSISVEISEEYCNILQKRIGWGTSIDDTEWLKE